MHLNLKRVASTALAVVMSLGLSVTAFAEGNGLFQRREDVLKVPGHVEGLKLRVGNRVFDRLVLLEGVVAAVHRDADDV